MESQLNPIRLYNIILADINQLNDTHENVIIADSTFIDAAMELSLNKANYMFNNMVLTDDECEDLMQLFIWDVVVHQYYRNIGLDPEPFDFERELNTCGTHYDVREELEDYGDLSFEL
jgi:hypothetical protein